MNKTRRRKLTALIGRTEVIKDELDAILAEEQEAYDNMPEGLQCSARGEDSETAIGAMEEAIELLSDAIDVIDEIT
jgi:predicted RNase H-like HicB family nuclease